MGFQQLSGKLQDGGHFGAGLPLAVLEHAETHGSTVRWGVIADVGVVDLCAKGDGWWFEWVGLWEGDGEVEFAASIRRASRSFHSDFPLEQVRLVGQGHGNSCWRRCHEFT